MKELLIKAELTLNRVHQIANGSFDEDSVTEESEALSTILAIIDEYQKHMTEEVKKVQDNTEL